MVLNQRQRAILDLLNHNGNASVVELAKSFSVSESTVRRDLTVLEDRGLLCKVYGGASSVCRKDGLPESSQEEKDAVMQQAKRRIAKYAASMIADDDFVFLDAGTTTGWMIDFLQSTKATFVTCSVAHAGKLARRGISVVIAGGKVKPSIEATSGSEAVAAISRYHFTKAFLGVEGIDILAGYSVSQLDEALVKERAVQQSAASYALADHTKFRRVLPVTFAVLKKCTILTDEMPDGRWEDHTVVKALGKDV